MRTLIFIITSTIISISAFTQSNFDRGFKEGYKKGYCLNRGMSCLAPLPPISPLPEIGEDNSSYQDGYNRGFEKGLNDNSGTSNEKQRYKTSSADVIDYVQKTDLSDIAAKVKILKQAKDKALELYKIGDFDRSLRISKAALKVSPRDVEFMMLCAVCSLELENWIEGKYYFKMLINNTQDKKMIKEYKDMINELDSGEYQKARAEEKKSEN